MLSTVVVIGNLWLNHLITVIVTRVENGQIHVKDVSTFYVCLAGQCVLIGRNYMYMYNVCSSY